MNRQDMHVTCMKTIVFPIIPVLGNPNVFQQYRIIDIVRVLYTITRMVINELKVQNMTIHITRSEILFYCFIAA